MGSNHRKHDSLTRGESRFIPGKTGDDAAGAGRRLLCNDNGDAVIEATLLFPIMTMIFAALVLAAIYLPSQAALQRATQYAATALATESSDTWLRFDDVGMEYYRESDKNRLANVYASLFDGNGASVGARGETITRNMESRSISSRAGRLEISCYVDDKVVYKEIIVEAAREYAVPVDLSFIGFPGTITVAATSTAVVQNGDEFVRNADLAAGFAQYAAEKFGTGDIGELIGGFGAQVKSLLGW